MGKFIFGDGSTPKKVLYNGVEVKKILFNNVEVWRKAVEAGSESVYFDLYSRGGGSLDFIVPDGVTKLKLTSPNGPSKILAVTPGENANFRFVCNTIGPSGGPIVVYYSFNGSGNQYIAGPKNSITIYVEWSEEINNS